MSTPLETLFEAQFQQQASSDPLKQMRQICWQRYRELGLPTRKNDPYRYVKLRHLFSDFMPAEKKMLAKQQVAAHLLPCSLRSHLVFINGYWQPDLSDVTGLPPQLVISPLSHAMQSYSAYLNNQWKQLQREGDPFAALNGALHPQGCFLYLPPKLACPAPLHILHITDTGEQPMISMPRLHLYIGRGAHLPIATTHISLSQNRQWTNGLMEMVLEENSAVQLVMDTRQLPFEARLSDSLRATLKRDCKLQAIHITHGSCTARTDWQVALTGENGFVDLNGLTTLSETHAAHANVLVDHQAPNCRSRQLFKAVLQDASTASFQGKIYVHPAAQKTEAYQLNNTLLLGQYAQSNSQPNLEIFADDVKASHGATIGQLNDEQLFYLLTRGVPKAAAKLLLIEAFCREVSDKIPGWYPRWFP